MIKYSSHVKYCNRTRARNCNAWSFFLNCWVFKTSTVLLGYGKNLVQKKWVRLFDCSASVSLNRFCFQRHQSSIFVLITRWCTARNGRVSLPKCKLIQGSSIHFELMIHWSGKDWSPICCLRLSRSLQSQCAVMIALLLLLLRTV